MQLTAPVKTAPGPRLNILLDPSLAVRNQTLAYLQSLYRDYGPVSRVRFGSFNVVFVADPDLIEHLLLERDTYVKMKEGSALAHFLGNGLLTSEGDFWLKQRRLIQPVFHKQRLEKMMKVFSSATDEILKEWEQKEDAPLDIYPEMNRLTLDIVSKTLLSADVKADFNRLSKAINNIMDALRRRPKLVRLPFWVPIPAHLKFQRNTEVLDETMYEIIAERRRTPQQSEDLLSMLMDVEDADTAERMTDKQLRDEVLTIFMAGHETTANALSFILYLLARNPEVKAKLQQEVSAIKGQEFSLDNIRKLEYTTMVINEAMRLYPPAWMIVREAAKDAEIGGYKVNKGDKVLVSPYVMHHREDLWPKPDKFDPERFRGEKHKSLPRYAYFPFGGGARLCVGVNFAMMEMQIILAQLCNKYDFSIPANFKLETIPVITLRPKNGVPLRLVRR